MKSLNYIKNKAFYDELQKIASLFHIKKNTSKFDLDKYIDFDDLVDVLEEDKEASLKEGKRYPSKEMKKEFDTDGPPPDLESATDYSPKYPTDHLSIKTAAMIPNKLLVNKVLARRYVPQFGSRLANRAVEGQHYLEVGRNYSETADDQDNQQSRSNIYPTHLKRFIK